MMAIIETGVNIFIAVIGVVIAALQFRIERIEYRREKERENEVNKKIQIMKGIANKTKSIESLVELTDHVDEFSKLPFTPEINGEWFSLIQEIYLGYNKSKKCIELLYSELLLNESEIPLSYGYGRYIDAFREYLLFGIDVKKLGYNICLLHELACKNAELQIKGEKINSEQYFAIRNEVCYTVSKLDLLLNNIVLLIGEIKIKYSNI